MAVWQHRLLGATSTTQTKRKSKQYLSHYSCQLTDDCRGAIVALFTAGGFFGAGLAGPCADWIGRRLAIIIGALTFILGGLLQAAAQNIAFLYAGRLIGGFGVGFMIMIVPLYQAEIAHPSIRGRVTALQQFMLGIGSVTASKYTRSQARIGTS